MKLIIEAGKDNVLFIGEGLESGGDRPFSGSAGSSVIRTGALNASVMPHYIELRKDELEDDITEEHVQQVHKYITTRFINKVIVLGKKSVEAFFPSIKHGQSMADMTSTPMLPPAEIPGIKVGVMYHQLSAFKSDDSDAIIDYWSKMENLLTDKVTAHVESLKISSDEEFNKLLDYLDTTNNMLALDYETNAVDPFNEKHYVTCIGLSKINSAMSATGFWYIPPKVIPPATVERFKNFLVKNSKRVYTFNVSFEIKVTWHMTGLFIKLQDARVLCYMYSIGGSLKKIIRSEMGVAMWEADVHEFKAQALGVFKAIAKSEELVAACLAGDVNTLLEYKGTANSIQWMLDNYTMEEVSEGLTHYPYEWGSIPKALLGNYCAKDAGYTALLASKFKTPEMAMAYDIYIRHPWLAAKFEVNGVYWNNDEATVLSKSVDEQKLELLYKVIKEIDIPPESKMGAKDIFFKKTPYEVIRYTEKTRQERRSLVKDTGAKIEDMKKYFNPGSNTEYSRQLFWKIYNTEEIQLASVLLLFLDNIELSGMLPKLHEAVGDKNFLYTNTPADVIEKILTITAVKSTLSSQVQRSLSFATEMLGTVINRFASEVIKYQYRVHTTFLGLKIADESTWSKEWWMIFNLYLYKKINKMQTTNIDGSTGRSSVSLIIGELHGKPLRGQSYWSLNEKQLKLPMILNTDFNSLSASTRRWTSGFHTIPQGSPARYALATPSPKHIWVHADFSQAELVVLAYLSADPAMIQSFLDGKDMHRFIASKAFNKAYDDITSAERTAAKAIGFGIIYGKSIENIAIEVTNGDVDKAQELFNSFFNAFPGIKIWMDSKRNEVDTLGYVTTLFGNHLAVDLTAPGNGKYRVAINAPIQCLASTIAGTAMFELTEALEEAKIESNPVGFTHDAYDDVTIIDTVVEYLELLVAKLQTEIYEKLGIPMRIDFEIGTDSFNLCTYKLTKKEGKLISIELEGTDMALEKLVSTFNMSSTFKVLDMKELSTKTKHHSYEELFTVGKSMKANWGQSVTTKSVELSIERLN